ncbi:hypothetical protein QAD02_002312, partial [Eretmocerus hayati]
TECLLKLCDHKLDGDPHLEVNDIRQDDSYTENEEDPISKHDYPELKKSEIMKNSFQKHEAYSIGFYYHDRYEEDKCFYDKFRGLNCVRKFAERLKEIAIQIQREIENFPPIHMTEEDEESFLNATVCHICGIMAFYQTLNNPAYPPKLKVVDMVIGKPYRILAGRMVNSPWGETCLLEIQDGEQIRTIHLPQKISQSVKANSRQILPAFNSGKDFVTHRGNFDLTFVQAGEGEDQGMKTESHEDVMKNAEGVRKIIIPDKYKRSASEIENSDALDNKPNAEESPIAALEKWFLRLAHQRRPMSAHQATSDCFSMLSPGSKDKQRGRKLPQTKEKRRPMSFDADDHEFLMSEKNIRIERQSDEISSLQAKNNQLEEKLRELSEKFLVEQNGVSAERPDASKSRNVAPSKEASLASWNERRVKASKYCRGYGDVAEGKKRTRKYKWALIADVNYHYYMKDSAGYANWKKRYLTIENCDDIYLGENIYVHHEEWNLVKEQKDPRQASKMINLFVWEEDDFSNLTIEPENIKPQNCIPG